MALLGVVTPSPLTFNITVVTFDALVLSVSNALSFPLLTGIYKASTITFENGGTTYGAGSASANSLEELVTFLIVVVSLPSLLSSREILPVSPTGIVPKLRLSVLTEISLCELTLSLQFT